MAVIAMLTRGSRDRERGGVGEVGILGRKRKVIYNEARRAVLLM